MCGHCGAAPSPSSSTYRLGMLAESSPPHVGLKTKSSCIPLRACACVCVPRGVGVCQKACNTQVLDWFEPCRSVTLIFRVQAKDEKMHTHTHTFVIRLFWVRWCHFCCCFCRPLPSVGFNALRLRDASPACIGVQGRRTLNVKRTSARGSEPREGPLNHRSNETFCPVWAGASHL